MIFALSVFLSNEEIEKLASTCFDKNLEVEKNLKRDKKNGKIGLLFLLIGLCLQGIGMLI